MNRASSRRRAPLALGVALAVCAVMLPALPAAAEPLECVTDAAGAMQVTAECVDPLYTQPIIDAETDETTPVAHHRVSGHFEGTNIQFNIYLHPQTDKAEWDGRFFQYTYPTTFTPGQNTSRASDRAIGFALASGGYTVQAGNDFLSLGYRHAAAAAKFAEQVAADYYGGDREIFGYLYGPSGGSFQAVGAAENTDGVWQLQLQRSIRCRAHPRRKGRPDPRRAPAGRQRRPVRHPRRGREGDAQRAAPAGHPLEGLGDLRLSARL
jgi:hypothetical protein